MRKKLFSVVLSFFVIVQMLMPSVEAKAAETYYNNKVGTIDGYDYELWKDYGTTSMTLNGGGAFSCSWSNIGNCLFRTGVKFDNTKNYKQIGKITSEYGCDFRPNGNSYLCVYGWMTNPLVEYYIVESWGTWRPPGATSKGTITVDGGTYEVYETTRVNQPSIQGDTTFQQYWSVRTSKRTSGTITVTDHFKAWESMGMNCGNLYEAALNVEGYQSSGSADVYKHEMKVGGSLDSGSSSGSSSGSNSNAGNFDTPASGAKVECEGMTVNGQYAGKIDSPFDGVALYANDESVSFTQNFTNATSDFTLRGCSNNDNMAKVDLIIGGENKGTFYYGDANPAEYTIKNVSHKTGNQKVELVVNSDDGNWDAYLDYFIVGGEGQSTSNNQSSSNNQGTSQSSNQSGNTQTTTTSAGTTQCESMTITGQYAGKIDSPFDGVALYANNDSVSFTQNFKNDTNDFTLRGCSNNDNMAKVDLIIGGENKGTFYFGDANPAEYTIKNVSHKTGNQKVELIVNSDDGNWDAFIDSLTISNEGQETNQTTTNNNQTSNTQTNTSQNTTQSNTQAVTGTTQCESMTITGQYAGKIDSPFDGVALYANDETVSFTQNFTSSSNDFTLRGCSNNDNMAKVDLIIGGENKGTFYYGDSYPAEYTLKNVSHKTGNQKVELIVNSDDGNWDAYLDYLTIATAGSVATSAASATTNTQQSNAKLVALTFDDGPSETTTGQILDILEKYGVPGTFFLIGKQVNSSTRLIMERQLELGCELGCHSYTHEDMSNMSASDVRNQYEWTNSAIKNTVGVDVKFFRPPYLNVSNTMYQNTDMAFIQGIDSGDWQTSVSASQRANTVLSNVKDGSIILMHDFEGNSNTVQALPSIIEGLKNQGYTFVTVSQLFERKGVNPNVEYKIWSNVFE